MLELRLGLQMWPRDGTLAFQMFPQAEGSSKEQQTIASGKEAAHYLLLFL